MHALFALVDLLLPEIPSSGSIDKLRTRVFALVVLALHLCVPVFFLYHIAIDQYVGIWVGVMLEAILTVSSVMWYTTGRHQTPVRVLLSGLTIGLLLVAIGTPSGHALRAPYFCLLPFFAASMLERDEVLRWTTIALLSIFVIGARWSLAGTESMAFLLGTTAGAATATVVAAMLSLMLQAALAEAEAAQNKAAEANRTKSEFLAAISHELRTPLHGLLGISESLLKQYERNTALRDDLRIVRSSGESLLSIVNDLLDIARIEAGKLEVRPTVFRPDQLLLEVVNLFRERAAVQGVDMLVRIDPRVAEVWVQADREHVRQVLTNFVSNALKYAPKSTVTVSVVHQGELLRFDVTDTGPGLTGEDQAAMFMPFSRVGDQRSKSVGGAGLGLYICKQLVELSGGQVGVISAPGDGARFWFSLPLDRQEAPAEVVAESTRLRRPMRVLIAEDNPVNQVVTSRMVSQIGGFAVIARDGGEALTQLLAHPFDACLLDGSMPVLDGPEVARRAREAGVATPLIGMTADIAGQQLLEAGVIAILPKPCSLAQMVKVLDSVPGPAIRALQSVNYDHKGDVDGVVA